MTLEGVIVNGQVQLDAPAPLPTGTRVRIEPVPAAPAPSNADQVAAWKAAARREREGHEPSTLAETLLSIAGTVHDLPPDFAAQHDHYIHGASKR
jgi:hypothetical protein